MPKSAAIHLFNQCKIKPRRSQSKKKNRNLKETLKTIKLVVLKANTKYLSSMVLFKKD